MGFIKEFKDFISRGNIFDMAVGVIMGSAFGKIVTALSECLIMPVITIFTGKVDVSELTWTIGVTTLPYGQFLQSIIDFLLTALAIFIMVKIINNAQKRIEAHSHSAPSEPEPKPEPEPSAEEKLLCEIRDILKNK